MPANAGDERDTGLIPGWEDPLEKEVHSSILAWKIPWTEKPGELLSRGCKESDTPERSSFNHIYLQVSFLLAPTYQFNGHVYMYNDTYNYIYHLNFLLSGIIL